MIPHHTDAKTPKYHILIMLSCSLSRNIAHSRDIKGMDATVWIISDRYVSIVSHCVLSYCPSLQRSQSFIFVWFCVCCADCIALSTSFVCMIHNILHYSTLSMSNNKNCRCCAISSKSQRHTARILWAWFEKCWYIIVDIVINCSSHHSNRLRYVVSGPRCCFSTIKLYISGMFGPFF